MSTIDLRNSKKITLGGKEYIIPELAFRQKRVTTPLILQLETVFKEKFATGKIAELTTEEYDKIAEVVFQGINRGLPHLTKEHFLDFVFNPLELIAAFVVVAEQSGFAMQKPEEKLPGESIGEDQASLPTGENITTTT